MDSQFLNRVAHSHRHLSKFPVCEADLWVKKLTSVLFPRSLADQLHSIGDIEAELQKLQKKLRKLIQVFVHNIHKSTAEQIAEAFFHKLPRIYQMLLLDAKAIMKKNPILKSEEAVFRFFPGFHALSYFRIAKQLHELKLPIIPNLITEAAFMDTCIELHHESNIGQGVVIYPGSVVRGAKTVVEDGTVIGEAVEVTQNGSIKVTTKTEKTVPTTNSESIPRPLAKSIDELIGNTPLVEIKHIFKHPRVKIYAKLEGDNPGGSVKDRAAYYMINQAFKRGDLKPGMTIIQPTSGNIGIALAMVARAFGVGIQLVMPENLPVQRAKTMEAYGAKVILTPAAKSVEYSRDYAKQKSKKKGYLMLDQFSNPDNSLAHERTTGPEIYRDTEGNVTHFVCGMGTTGTAMGVSKYLKKKDKNIKIIGVQPAPGSGIPGIKKWSKQYLPSIYEPGRLDELIDISGMDSVVMTRRLAKQEGIFAGMSSGTAMCAAVQVANKLDNGVVVVIICDRGDRYLSIPLFNN